MKNEDALGAHGRDVSQIEETNKTRELFTETPENAPKSENVKKIIDMGEFKEEWGTVYKSGIAKWGSWKNRCVIGVRWVTTNSKQKSK